MERYIVNIVSLSHSGSTLLGNILDCSKEAMHIGELVDPIRRKRPIICWECLEDICPVWGSAIKEADMLATYNDYRNWMKQGRLAKMVKKPALSGNLYSLLFKSDENLKFVIDSSKNIYWCKYNRVNKKYKHKYIFLKRDVKGVYAALKRSRSIGLDEELAGLTAGIKDLNDFYQTLGPKEKMVVNYESLEDMEGTVREICEFLQLKFDKNMLQFNEFPHHLIGGNQANFIQRNKDKTKKVLDLLNAKSSGANFDHYAKLKGFKKDMRWETELSDSEKEKIDSSIKNLFAF